MPPGPATRNTRKRSLPLARQLKVLIVDDNIDAALTLAELLQAHGHRAQIAHDGAAALALFDTFVPDLAILDLGLPVLDGYALAKVIRMDPRFRGIPLIALTGYDLPHHRQRSREVGFDHHIAKPLRWDLLDKLLTWYSVND